VDILPLIPEIKALVSSGQLDNQTQRPPFTFTSGQVLQATVISRDAPNLFTLSLGGQEVPVQTSAQLQPGQSLSVEVTTSSPQLQLQIVDTTTINQRIGTTLHSMINQGEAFSHLSTLAESTPQLTQLSTSSQEVLQQMQANLSGFAIGSSRIQTLVEQISSSLLSSVSNNKTMGSANTTTPVNQLLQQLANQPELSPALRESAADLAKVFSSTRFSEVTIDVQTATATAAIKTATATGADLRQQLTALNPSLQISLLPLIEQLGPYFSTTDGKAIEQLFTFLIQVGMDTKTSANPSFDGRQLQQSLHKLGLNMEQLLLQGKTQEAGGTLKFALLELAGLTTNNEAHLQQIDEILGSIQFSQLMQMRLSPEALLFLPLPFPHLLSGFLLIEDQAKNDDTSSKKKGRNGRNNDVNMYLQLEGLGNLNITLHQDEDKISLTFYSQDSERAKFMRENRDALQQMLTTGNLYSAQFLVGAKEPIKILIEKLLHDTPTGMVNTIA